MTSSGGVEFLKGHGTGNDFVVLPDFGTELDLTAERVRALCDRRTGLGADGVLRVVPDSAHGYFMDHRNADGSTAEMCGNGARVFARYLVDAGLAAGPEFAFATNAGPLPVRIEADGTIAVEMGIATTPLLRAMPVVTVGDRSWEAVGVLVPNPHAVAFVDDLDDAGSLREAPEVAPGAVFPDGVNVEFVVERGPAHIAMRVYERGVGETQACGTGACAAAWAARRRDGAAADPTYTVDVPGGRLRVSERADGVIELAGPAVIVAAGYLDGAWWAGIGRS